jgi:hypothetical protein
MMRSVLVVAQAATFVALGIVLFASGQLKLGAAQILLAGVTALVYSA